MSYKYHTCDIEDKALNVTSMLAPPSLREHGDSGVRAKNGEFWETLVFWTSHGFTAPEKDDVAHQHSTLNVGGPHGAPPLLEELLVGDACWGRRSRFL